MKAFLRGCVAWFLMFASGPWAFASLQSLGPWDFSGLPSTILPDDSILVGVAQPSSGTFAVAKFHADWTLDPAWHGGIAPLGDVGTGTPLSILSLPDGGVIVVTASTLTRLNNDGGVDMAFGTNGHYGVAADDPAIGAVQSAALEYDGSVVVLSQRKVGANRSNLIHILANGTLDPTFGTRGYMPIADPTTAGQSIYAWSVKDDGSAEVGYMDSQAPPQPVLRRFPADFTAADRPHGRLMPRAGVASWVGPTVLVDGAGGAVFAVMTSSGPNAAVELERFLPDGSVDPGFGLIPIAPSYYISSAPVSVRLWRSVNGKWFGLLTLAEDVPLFPTGYRQVNTYAVMFATDGRPDPDFPTTNTPRLHDNNAYGLHDNGPAIRTNAGPILVDLQPLTQLELIPNGPVPIDTGPRVEGILIEYYHPVLRHYFLTLDTFEAAYLDSTPSSGWTRTGRTFAAWQPVPAPATTAVCRFYGDPVIGPNSHFYTPEGPECDALIALEQATPPGMPVWHLEAKPFRVSVPSLEAACPGNLDPVYRVFNGPVDNAHGPTHRYTTDPALYAQMQSLGWLPEGVHFCVPPLGPRGSV